ncbi:MAG TPA: hypothetical protein VK745_31770 [Polyangiaceae bacterium]|jgi:hypothetical protein|nr:hypothetical protein [Polyangiaceae bacterium]
MTAAPASVMNPAAASSSSVVVVGALLGLVVVGLGLISPGAVAG